MNIAEAHKLLVYANTHRGEVFEMGIQALVGWAKGNSWCEWVRCELPPLLRTDYGYNQETAVDRLSALRTVVQWQDGNDVIVVYGSETADLLRDMPGICLPVIDVQRLVRAANPFWAGGARYALLNVCEKLGLKAPSLAAESSALVTGRVLYLLTQAAPADVAQLADACSRLAEEQDNADDRYRAKRTNAPDDNAVAWWTSLGLEERAAKRVGRGGRVEIVHVPDKSYGHGFGRVYSSLIAGRRTPGERGSHHEELHHRVRRRNQQHPGGEPS